MRRRGGVHRDPAGFGHTHTHIRASCQEASGTASRVASRRRGSKAGQSATRCLAETCHRLCGVLAGGGGRPKRSRVCDRRTRSWRGRGTTASRRTRAAQAEGVWRGWLSEVQETSAPKTSAIQVCRRGSVSAAGRIQREFGPSTHRFGPGRPHVAGVRTRDQRWGLRRKPAVRSPTHGDGFATSATGHAYL